MVLGFLAQQIIISYSWIIMFLFFILFEFAIILVILLLGKGVLTATIKAKLKGSPLLVVPRRDRFMDFVTGKYSGGVLESKKYGFFVINPKSSYLTASGSRASIHPENSAVSIDYDTIRAMEVLRKHGINDIRQLDMLNPTREKILNELANNKEITKEQKEKLNQVLNGINEKLNDKEVIDAGENIERFMRYSATPTFIRAVTERKARELAKDIKGFDPKWVMVLLVLLIGGAIAIYIIQSARGGGADASMMRQLSEQLTAQRVVTGTQVT